MPNTKRALFAAALLAAACTLVLTAFPARALTVKPGHPRIFFHADSLAAIRARANGPNIEIYRQLRDLADASLPNPGRQNGTYAALYATMYLLSGTQSYGNAAVRIAMSLARHDQEVTGEASGPAAISGVALAYDWAYPLFTAAQRDTIVRKFVTNLGHPCNASNHPWLYWDLTWSYAYAIAGDAGSNNAFVLSKLQESMDNLADAEQCLNVLAPNGAIDGYAGTRIFKMMALADCIQLGTDYGNPYLDSVYLRNSPRFWMARFRPDLKWSRLPGKYNTQESNPSRLFSFFGSRMGDASSQALANALIGSGHWLDDDGVLDSPVLLAFYVPSRAALPLDQAPLTFWDPGMGFLLCRDGWNMSGTGQDVTLGFFNGPDTQGHKTQNHFFISRGRDNLLIDSGWYKGDIDDHYANYYTRAVAHNTVSIYRAGESFGTYTNWAGHTRNIANDGGQQNSDLPGGLSRWPTCDGTYGYRGEIRDYEETPEYVHLIGDATPAYNSSKVRKVLRRFVYLRPNWVLVQDQIQLAAPNAPVRALYHSVSRPVPDTPLSVIEGNLGTGGIFRAPNAKEVTIDNGASSARIFVVQAEGGSAEVRIVGGQASNGTAWRQKIEPQDALTYDATRQGYECWIDGTNYPTGGPYLHESDIDSRNIPPNTAGDWRTEVLVQNAASEVRITTLIQIAPLGAPMPAVISSVSGDQLSIGVQDGGNEFHIAVCPPGNPCGQMNYTH